MRNELKVKVSDTERTFNKTDEGTREEIVCATHEKRNFFVALYHIIVCSILASVINTCKSTRVSNYVHRMIDHCTARSKAKVIAIAFQSFRLSEEEVSFKREITADKERVK